MSDVEPVDVLLISCEYCDRILPVKNLIDFFLLKILQFFACECPQEAIARGFGFEASDVEPVDVFLVKYSADEVLREEGATSHQLITSDQLIKSYQFITFGQLVTTACIWGTSV